MKKAQNLFLASLLLFSVNAMAQFADPAINILMTPASVPVNQTGILQVDLGNYGNSNIVANSLRATISVGNNAEIMGIQNASSDSRWTVLNLTAGTNNTIQLKNTGGSLPSFDVGTVNLIVKGKVESPASTITGNIVYIAGINPLIGAPSISQGNGQTLNDNSTTSLIVSAGGPLPVKLEYFNVSVNNCSSRISWKSSTELNFKNYIVEYSADGSVYTQVAVVAGKGNGTVYNVQHAPANGNAYYRLKSVDLDGKFTYSNIVLVKNQCGKTTVLVYPNPASDYLNINIADAGNNKTMAALYNASGHLVKSLQLQNGSNRVDCSGMANGIYQVKVMAGDYREDFKVLITH